jgi:hypothetical protein
MLPRAVEFAFQPDVRTVAAKIASSWPACHVATPLIVAPRQRGRNGVGAPSGPPGRLDGVLPSSERASARGVSTALASSCTWLRRQPGNR